jgi:hypothetical protein
MQPERLLSGMKALLIAILTCLSCAPIDTPNPYPRVGAIPVPAGYQRLSADADPFAAWLRHIALRKDRTVFLYNGTPKRNQDAQFAVLDVSVGRSDLQQCADAVMRLRAEYLYAHHDLAGIDFYSERGIRFNFQEWAAHRQCSTRACFDNYLNTVFNWCSTRTLEKQLVSKPLGSILPGDVFIKGGSPGHAMIVMDVAEDKDGHRLYLLAQSYMPAQDIHIVKNPTEPAISPWFRADLAQPLVETPEWTFTTNQLRTWPKK